VRNFGLGERMLAFYKDHVDDLAIILAVDDFRGLAFEGLEGEIDHVRFRLERTRVNLDLLMCVTRCRSCARNLSR